MSTETILLDMEILEEFKDLMEERFPVMVSYLIEDTASHISRIQKGLLKPDLDDVGASAHMLKSSSRQLGAVFLSDAAKTIEHTARDSHLNSGSRLELLRDQLSELEYAFAETKKALLKL